MAQHSLTAWVPILILWLSYSYEFPMWCPMFLERSRLPKLIKCLSYPQATVSQRWTRISFISVGHWWIDLVWGLSEKTFFKYWRQCLIKTTYEKQNLHNEQHVQSHLSTTMFGLFLKSADLQRTFIRTKHITKLTFSGIVFTSFSALYKVMK